MKQTLWTNFDPGRACRPMRSPQGFRSFLVWWQKCCSQLPICSYNGFAHSWCIYWIIIWTDMLCYLLLHFVCACMRKQGERVKVFSCALVFISRSGFHIVGLMKFPWPFALPFVVFAPCCFYSSNALCTYECSDWLKAEVKGHEWHPIGPGWWCLCWVCPGLWELKRDTGYK